MARAGGVIENPVSGERARWIQTAEDTDGELLNWEHTLLPGARVPVHVHPRQEERFEVSSGTPSFRVGRMRRQMSPGERVVVPRGTVHGFRNDTSEDIRVVVELRPALRTEHFFEMMFALARVGKVNRRGIPNPLQTAVILRDCPDTAYLPWVPLWMQRALYAALAGLGRLIGYRPPHL